MFVGLVLYGVWHGTRIERLTISEVIVSGGETISHEAVVADVTTVLEGDYARYIPRRFAWTYPEDEIMKKLTAVERVKDPQISRDGKTLNVTLAEYEPAALWCSATEVKDCVFLDAAGYGFAVAPELSGGAFVRYALVGQSAKTGEDYTDFEDFLVLQDLITRLSQVGWPVALIELDQARDAFVYLSGGGELKVSLLLTPAETIDNLQTIRTTAQYIHLEPGNFAYIDLRFGNKVFVNEFGTPVEEVAEAIILDEEEEGETETETAASDDAAGQ